MLRVSRSGLKAVGYVVRIGSGLITTYWTTWANTRDGRAAV